MILDRSKAIKRVYFGKPYEDIMELPNLIGIQLSSYEKRSEEHTSELQSH